MSHLFQGNDVNTNSNYHDVATRHTQLQLAIDFDRKVVSGTTTIALEATKSNGLRTVTLDTRSLKVFGASIGGNPVRWDLEQTRDHNGQPLHVHLDHVYAQGESFELNISFETTAQCTGLQWFTPEQTDDKFYPFMFSQGEPVHARSIFPCLDTPSVKSTFDITISSQLPVVSSGVPKHDLLFPPVHCMSAMKEYKFEQHIPIANYLFAVASGNMAGAQVGTTSYVYATPSSIDACVAEFKPDIQAIINAAEDLITKNPWPLYNLVVLPKSFHLGGMENPVFNFYSATVVSGDRENISVVAHEFAHTFSGNLVTNASWEHFWLNEGWTVYIEREILRRLRGDSAANFEAIVGWNELVYGIEAYGGSESLETCLVLRFQGKRPDDVMSKISYEKGFTFLCFLEKTVGKEKWLFFLPHYFEKFARTTIDSEGFKNAVLEFFANDAAASQALSSVDWETWYHKPGLPPKPDFQSQKYDECASLAKKWSASANDSPFRPCPDDVKDWTAGQLLVFLDTLIEAPEPITSEASQLLGSTYGLRSSKNYEILSRYLRVGLRARDRSLLKDTEDILGDTGRMKFVKPLFESLQSLDVEFANKTFVKYQSFYHPTCLRLLEKVLGIEQVDPIES